MTLKLATLTLCLAAALQATPIDKAAERPWWQSSALYQVYPRSFKDSNNDGIGDLKGIIEKLPYLRDTGIGAVWLSPIYSSPMVDFGYDISDFTNIHPDYGTMADFQVLANTARELGLKLVMDIVPNHSSDQHEWFLKSAAREEGYEDYYVWKDSRGNDSNGAPIPPNNWVSVFHGSAWSFHEGRGQFYLHQFAAGQPDLNYRNPVVVQEMKDVISFWMDKGVDGFRIDAIPFLFETREYQDEPKSSTAGDDPLDYGYLQHIYSFGQPETYDMVQQWRELIDTASAADGIQRCIMVEAYDTLEGTMKYYGTADRPGAHFPFNFQLIGLTETTSARDIKGHIDQWMDNLPSGADSNWLVGNHDNNRIASKVGADIVDSINALVTLLPGLSVTYYGEELGMVDNRDITYEEGVDPQGCNYPPDQFAFHTRDFERTPFQWDNSTNAGFNTGFKPWLPVNKNYLDLNLEAQKKEEYSHYTIYTELLQARALNAALHGVLNSAAVGQDTLAYVRSLSSEDFLVVVLNLGHEPETVNLDQTFTLGDRQLTVYTTNKDSGIRKKQKVPSTKVELAARSFAVFTP